MAWDPSGNPPITSKAIESTESDGKRLKVARSPFSKVKSRPLEAQGPQAPKLGLRKNHREKIGTQKRLALLLVPPLSTRNRSVRARTPLLAPSSMPMEKRRRFAPRGGSAGIAAALSLPVYLDLGGRLGFLLRTLTLSTSSHPRPPPKKQLLHIGYWRRPRRGLEAEARSLSRPENDTKQKGEKNTKWGEAA